RLRGTLQAGETEALAVGLPYRTTAMHTGDAARGTQDEPGADEGSKLQRPFGGVQHIGHGVAVAYGHLSQGMSGRHACDLIFWAKVPVVPSSPDLRKPCPSTPCSPS